MSLEPRGQVFSHLLQNRFAPFFQQIQRQMPSQVFRTRSDPFEISFQRFAVHHRMLDRTSARTATAAQAASPLSRRATAASGLSARDRTNGQSN